MEVGYNGKSKEKTFLLIAVFFLIISLICAIGCNGDSEQSSSENVSQESISSESKSESSYEEKIWNDENVDQNGWT